MSRLMAMALLVGVLAGLLGLPVSLVEATTMQGQVVDLTGVNDFNATADAQARTGVGKLLGYALFGASAVALSAGYFGTAAGAGAGGTVWMFASRIVNTGMDAANSATVGEIVYRLSYGLQVQLGFLGLRLLQDPVFYVALVLTLLSVTSRRGSRLHAT